MSDATDRRSTPPAEPGGGAVALDDWRRSLADARVRTARLRSQRRQVADLRGDVDVTALHELSLTYEELAVAEEELRVQNEELTRARAVIEAERERYRQLFLQAPVPYLVTDPHGRLIEGNQAATNLLGRRPDHLVGKPIVVFASAASRRRCRDVLHALNAGENSATTRFMIVRRSGSPVPVEATASASRTLQGVLVEIRWLLIDQRPRRRREASRRRRAEELEGLVALRTKELERTQRLKDHLVATVSHELRTPLAAIGGYAELLLIGLRGPLSDVQRSDVQRIQRACGHLARIVDDLLDYSRLAGKNLSFDIQDVCLEESLRGVVELIAPQASEANVSLDVDVPTRSTVVHADAERLRQIVLNLLGNAVKFTPPGGTVRLGMRVTETEAIVEVDDTGPGIPSAEREAIFEPFVRLRADGMIPGTGLGLAISREMAREMGGDVAVVGGTEHGSRFALRLPLSTRIAGHSQPG
jgi:PAS domain S-box-containing protein